MKRRGSTRSGVYIRRVLCSLKVCKMMHKFFCPSHQIVHNSLPKDFDISIFKKPETYCSVCVSPLRDWVGNRCLSLLLSSSCLYSYKIIYILTGWSEAKVYRLSTEDGPTDDQDSFAPLHRLDSLWRICRYELLNFVKSICHISS